MFCRFRLHMRRRCFWLVGLPFLVVSFACQQNLDAKKQRYFESAERYFDKGDYPAALVQYGNALQLESNFALGHYKLGQTYLKLHRYRDAYRELERTIELDPSNSKAVLDLGLMLITSKSYEQVQPIAAKMLAKHPQGTEAHLLLSELYRVQGKDSLAMQEIRNAIALDPQQPQLLVQQGTIQTGVNKAEAEMSFKKALELDPNFVPAVQSLATLYEASGRGAEAERELRYAIQLDSRNIEPRKSLALLYFWQQRKEEAEQIMIQAKKDLGGTGDNYRVLGEYYNNVGEGDKALAEFASISKQHPEDSRTGKDYIRLLLSHGRTQEALELNDAILRENPKDTGSLVIQSTILNSERKYDEASAVLQDALRDAPEDAYGHYQLGVALSKTGNPERAKQEWFEAAKLAPQMTEVQLALADVARQQKDVGLLRESAEQIIRNNPSDPQGYLLRAECESGIRQMAAAERDLKKAIEVAPQNAGAYSAMGSFLRSEGRDKAAEHYYEQALDRNPEATEALAAIVSIFTNQKQTAKALTRVQEQISRIPSNDSFYLLLAGLQVQNKDLRAGISSLQSALRINRHNIDAAILLSKVQLALGDRDGAMVTAYEAVGSNPGIPIPCFFVGTLEEMLGRTQKAEEMYRKALDLDPNYAPAANNLAYLMLQNRENLDSALELARRAQKNMPDSASAADTLAWGYYQKGLYGFAAGLLHQALQKEPDNATYHYHLGMVYHKQNNKQEARKHLQRVLEINPNYPIADQIRTTLKQMYS